MFRKHAEIDPMYALRNRLDARDVSAGYEFLRLFQSRPDLDPVLHDLIKAVALVASDMIGEDDD